MRTTTLEELSQRIDNDLGWRKKEITSLSLVISDLQGEPQRAVLRGSLAVLYAHWEGFVKECIFFYLNFVDCQCLSANQLNEAIVAFIFRNKLGKFHSDGLGIHHIDIIRDLRNQEPNRLRFPRSSRDIDTMSNLSSKRFRTLINFISISIPSKYDDTLSLIDTDLVLTRNAISHGNDDVVTINDWETIRDLILEIISYIGDEILNAAICEYYLKH
ncbi:MAE_28990/MAE_18760 family HEPN-like nuclease [Arthrobacter dokdonensis]|uniref:MAE_28990/MAE_18760 family HEPN-like nuclease n=1 Tax=Arthrobacter dokdonellae TaxID=2211210 RepID=UPI001493E40C